MYSTFESAHLGRQQGDGVLLRDADEGNRAGRRGDDADLDLGVNRQAHGQGDAGGGEQGVQLLHCVSSLMWCC
jgi:hypothetical protein